MFVGYLLKLEKAFNGTCTSVYDILRRYIDAKMALTGVNFFFPIQKLLQISR